MERVISDVDILAKFSEEFSEIVEKHTKYVIISGYFAIATGRVRGTEDIDMFINKIDLVSFKKLHDDLSNKFICVQDEDPIEIYNYLKDGASVRYTYKNQMLPEMEIKFPKDELDLEQIHNRKKYFNETQVNVYFPEVEAQIAFKEEYLKANKDIEDAKHLRGVFFDIIDESIINKYKDRIKRIKLK